MILWSLWLARNKCIFHDKDTPPRVPVEYGLGLLKDYWDHAAVPRPLLVAQNPNVQQW